MVTSAVLLALLFGLLSGSGNLLISGLLLGTLCVMAAIGWPKLLFWIATLGSLVLAGLFELYLPNFQALRWAFAGAAGLFLVAVLLRRFGRSTSQEPPQPALTWVMLAFAVVFVVSLVANWRGGVAAIFGTKNYFQVWGLFFGMALMPAWIGLYRSLPRALLAVGLLQLPFVLHQFLVLVPQRVSIGGLTAVDVVAGTFGASLSGGGNNAALSMFLIVCAAVLAAKWRTGALRARWLWLMPWLLAPIFLNESKVAIVYLLLAFGLVFRREILSRPLRFIGLSLTMLVLGVALVFSYVNLSQSGRVNSVADLVEQVVRQNTEEGQRYGSLTLNRGTSLAHWAQERRRYPLLSMLIGHGPSESKLSGGLLDRTDNLSTQRYGGMGIGITSISAILWDFGLVGLVALLAIYVSAYRLAGKLAQRHADSAHESGLFQGLQAGVAILALSLLHKASFTYQLGYQVFTLLVLGFLVAAWRWPPPVTGAAVVPARPARR